jgi:HD superfamily phosphohydrolase YqeK
MESWALAFERDPDEPGRWRAAGMLHDALRDASTAALRSMAGSIVEGLPDSLLHGPAAAHRLREDGVRDEPLLRAIQWHTLGHPDLDRLGRALYLADHLEPGRPYDPGLNAHRRERVRHAMDEVLREVAADRIARTVRQGYPLLEPTVRFWNGIVHV